MSIVYIVEAYVINNTIFIVLCRSLTMKKFFIFFVMSIICRDVWSQGKSKTQSKFGFKLGLGIHTVTGCPVKTKPGIAFMGGIWVQLKIGKSWTMQSELNRIDKGTGLNEQNQPMYGDYWLQLSYFEVPILFQYKKKEAYVEFGPGLAALINVGEYTNGAALPYPTDLYPFSKKEVFFNLGTGYLFNEKWRVGLRLIHSLLSVRKQLPEISRQVYNRGIVFSVSRQINVKDSGTKQSQAIE